jgi:hypothetical protein
VLLRDCRRCGQSNFHGAPRDARELRADGLHETLFGETRPNARFKLRVLWCGGAQRMLSSLQFGTDLSANRIMRTRHLGAVPNVRYWHKADIQVSPANVRFRG